MTIRLPGGLELTLAQALELADDPPANLSDRQKRRLAKFAADYSSTIRRTQRERYTAVMAQARKVADELSAEVEKQEQAVEQIHSAVRSGRITAKEAREGLTKVFRDIKVARERLAGIERNAEQGWEVACQDPSDFQQRWLQRFPSLRGATLTESYLDGEEGGPFDSGRSTGAGGRMRAAGAG